MHYCVLLTVLRLHSSLNTSLPLRYQALAEFIPIIVCHGLQMYFLDSDEEEISSDDDEANPTTPTEDALTWNRILNGTSSHGLSDTLGRKRKLRPPPSGGNGKRKISKYNKTDPKSVSAKVRRTEYPREPFEVITGRLWCKCCSTELSLKTSSIKQHIRSSKHQGKITAISNDIVQQRIHDMVEMNSLPTMKLADEVHEHRLKVCYAFLLYNIKFSTLKYSYNPNSLKNLLEFQRGTLPEREVRDKIPDIQKLEFEILSSEMNDSDVAVIFDGTSSVCEVFGIVLRFISKKNGLVTQRALALEFIKKSMTAEEQVNVLTNILLYRYQINPSRIVAFIRDGCSTNNCTLSLLKVISTTALDITCISHGCNIFGSTVMKCVPLLGRFVRKWSTLLTVSTKATRKFRALLPCGENIFHTSEVRWFAEFEVACQIYKYWDHVESVLNDSTSFADDMRKSLKQIILENKSELRIQLSIVTDKCKVLCNMCHEVEGDNFISPLAYDLWIKMMDSFNSNDSPSLSSELRTLYPFDDEMQQVVFQRSIDNYLQSGRNKLKDDQANRLHEVLMILRACRIFNYKFISNQHEETLIVEDSGEFRYLNKLPRYYKLCGEHGDDYYTEELQKYIAYSKIATEKNLGKSREEELEMWTFWIRHKLNMPKLYQLACDVALIVPSSCSVERLFSMLEQRYSTNQEQALEDLKATGTMLAYNTLFREKTG